MPKDEKNKVKQWVHKKEHWADENPKKNCAIQAYYQRLKEEGIPRKDWPKFLHLYCPCKACNPYSL